MRCHDQGMKTFRDDIRSAVERLPGSPGFDKRRVLELYPPREEMDPLVAEDGARFLAAMEQLLGKPQGDEPLIPVSRRFLEAPLQLSTAAAELGLAEPGDLAVMFRAPQFASLGLIPLASQGVVRRDMWEDYYDRVVRQLGLGIPVVPLDGVIRRDYPADSPPFDVELSTNKKNNIFAPGDELTIFVTNRSNAALRIELVGPSAQGQKVVLAPASTTVAAGGQFRFPPQGTIKIQGGQGAEQITLLASDQEFPAGQLLRGEGVTDRLVRPFFDTARMVKRTLVIETR
jgi:serine/threonine-protein kinase